MANAGRDPESVGLPLRPFLYTVDQVAGLLVLSNANMMKMCFFEGRTTRIYDISLLRFLNIANDGDTPLWRCAEIELIRWMRKKGFYIFETHQMRTKEHSRNPNSYKR